MYFHTATVFIFITGFTDPFTVPLKVLVQTVVFYFTLSVFEENVSSVCECVFVGFVNQ